MFTTALILSSRNRGRFHLGPQREMLEQSVFLTSERCGRAVERSGRFVMWRPGNTPQMRRLISPAGTCDGARPKLPNTRRQTLQEQQPRLQYDLREWTACALGCKLAVYR